MKGVTGNFRYAPESMEISPSLSQNGQINQEMFHSKNQSQSYILQSYDKDKVLNYSKNQGSQIGEKMYGNVIHVDTDMNLFDQN